MNDPGDALRDLAAQLRRERTPISAHVVEPTARPVLGELAAAGRRTSSPETAF